jgi:hypothetical protein
MKNTYHYFLIMMTMGAFNACSVKSTNTSLPLGTSTSGTSTSTTGTGTGTGTGTTTTGGVACDGVYHDGATRCYYKNIPTIQVMGAVAGNLYWSSTKLTSSGTGISPNQFATDGTFNVRIIPRISMSTTAASNPSAPGKPCSAFMHNSSKLYVQLRLRQSSASNGEIGTLTAAIDTPSNVWHFSPPVTNTPLVLEVTNVMADIRCTQSGGKNYCPYADIPLSNPTSTTIPTECVAFDVQYSTDETYDLPGSPAN